MMDPLSVEELLQKETWDFSEELDLTCIPRHIAIIMDGNRRWARQKKLPYMVGHSKGAETLTKIVNAAAALGVKILTVYSFSTENWGRSPEEIEALMHLIKTYLLSHRQSMIDKGIKLETIGDLSRLPLSVTGALEECKLATRQGNKIQLTLALNYGGRDDIRRAALSMIEDCTEGKLCKKEISEEVFSQYLDTARWEDPQLLIRTSGENRLSNFLLWQISYAEIYVTETLWPDFSERNLLQAVWEYQQRERRFGGGV